MPFTSALLQWFEPTSDVWAGLVLAAQATPSPSPTNPNTVTPGVWGFALTAFIMIAAALLIFDLVRRVRRLEYRELARQEVDAEQAELERARARANEDADEDTSADSATSSETGEGRENPPKAGTASAI